MTETELNQIFISEMSLRRWLRRYRGILFGPLVQSMAGLGDDGVDLIELAVPRQRLGSAGLFQLHLILNEIEKYDLTTEELDPCRGSATVNSWRTWDVDSSNLDEILKYKKDKRSLHVHITAGESSIEYVLQAARTTLDLVYCTSESVVVLFPKLSRDMKYLSFGKLDRFYMKAMERAQALGYHYWATTTDTDEIRDNRVTGDSLCQQRVFAKTLELRADEPVKVNLDAVKFHFLTQDEEFEILTIQTVRMDTLE